MVSTSSSFERDAREGGRRPKRPFAAGTRASERQNMGAARRLCLSKGVLVALCVLLGYAGVALAQEDHFKPASVSADQVTSDQPYYKYELDRLLLGHLSETSAYYPTNFVKSSELESGKRESFELEASLCTDALYRRVMAYKDATDNATRPDLYEQLHIMVEVWDVGVQKGDGLLSMSVDEKPYVSYDRNSGNWTQENGAYSDFSSHNLFLRYHKLTAPVDMPAVASCMRGRTAEKCAKTLVTAALYNVEHWTRQRLLYHAVATCDYAGDMPCEKSLGPLSQECNGKGKCVKPGETVTYDANTRLVLGNDTTSMAGQAAKSYDLSRTTEFTNTHNQSLCQCDAFYGNTGCQNNVFELKEGEWRYEVGLRVDKWRYYRYMGKHSKDLGKNLKVRKYLRVQLRRTQGDTILFAKNVMDGSIVNGLPHLQDYQTRSDKDSFRNRKDYHYIVMDDVGEYENQVYYIAVLNNNAQIKMDAKYHIRVDEIVLPESGDDGVCGNDCGGTSTGVCRRGRNGEKDYCMCYEDYAGPLCEGNLERLNPQQTYSGMLSAGEIHYYRMDIASDKNMKHYSVSDGFLGPIKWDLIIEFHKDGGQVVVMGNYQSTPSMHSNDFAYTFGIADDHNATATQSTMLTRPEMEKGVYYLAVFNHNYQEPSVDCSYSIRVSLVSNVNLIYGPYIPVVLGVLVAMFLLLLTGVCWKFALRHTSIGRILFNNSHAGARTFSLDGLGRPAPGEGGEQGNPAGGNQGRGLSKECIARLPEIRYCLPVGECNEDEPVCSICLSEFEKDDVLKRIPACNHEFHKSCIEQWLCQHTSCPMCRVEIGSEPQEQRPLPHSPSRSSPELEDEVEEDGGVAGRRSTVARHTVAVELQPIRRASDPVTTSNVAMGGYEAFPSEV